MGMALFFMMGRRLRFARSALCGRNGWMDCSRNSRRAGLGGRPALRDGSRAAGAGGGTTQGVRHAARGSTLGYYLEPLRGSQSVGSGRRSAPSLPAARSGPPQSGIGCRALPGGHRPRAVRRQGWRWRYLSFAIYDLRFTRGGSGGLSARSKRGWSREVRPSLRRLLLAEF